MDSLGNRASNCLSLWVSNNSCSLLFRSSFVILDTNPFVLNQILLRFQYNYLLVVTAVGRRSRYEDSCGGQRVFMGKRYLLIIGGFPLVRPGSDSFVQ